MAKTVKKKTARARKPARRGVAGEIAQYARSSARAVTKAARKAMGGRKTRKAKS
jgi:hypothetical protein